MAKLGHKVVFVLPLFQQVAGLGPDFCHFFYVICDIHDQGVQTKPDLLKGITLLFRLGVK